jgi:hypothetical protein
MAGQRTRRDTNTTTWQSPTACSSQKSLNYARFLCPSMAPILIVLQSQCHAKSIVTGWESQWAMSLRYPDIVDRGIRQTPTATVAPRRSTDRERPRRSCRKWDLDSTQSIHNNVPELINEDGRAAGERDGGEDDRPPKGEEGGGRDGSAAPRSRGS